MIRNILKEKDLDGIVITSRENRIYLSGFTGTEGLLVITPDESFIFVDSRYTLQAKSQTKGFTVKEFSQNPFSLLADFNFKRLGFEETTILYSQFLKLPKCETVGVSKNLSELRMVKTKDEIEKMKIAAQIADMAFSHILKFIKEGITEIEIANELEFFMRQNGAQALSFDTIAAIGERSALPHAYPTEKTLKKGDIVLMDYGCVYDGYSSDMTRTVAFGEIPDELKEIYNIVETAQKTAENAVKPKKLCRDIDKIARDIIAENGYKENFGHSLGHGVGLEIHESPNLSPKSPHTLKENMVVTVEPGIYVPNLGGVRIEDMIYVTENGFESFTKSPKGLIKL